MVDLQLTRTQADKHLYELAGYGTLRLTGWLKRSGTAEAGGARWELARRGAFRTSIEASDASGAVIGVFEGRTFRGGGTLRWGDRTLALETDSFWKQRYALSEGERTLATIEGKTWGKRPVELSIDDTAAIEPGLLLFAAFVVRALAEDAASASAGASSGAV